MTTKELLLEQFNISYDENGWFVALKNAIAGLSAEDARWKTENLDNSTWEILAHLNYYNFAYLERFKGVDYVYAISSNDETFEVADTSPEAWQREIERFEAIMDEWRALLTDADEAKLDEPVSEKNQDSWATLLSNVTMHNAYHGGQIIVVRKLQKSWDASKGVS